MFHFTEGAEWFELLVTFLALSLLLHVIIITSNIMLSKQSTLDTDISPFNERVTTAVMAFALDEGLLLRWS